MSSDAAPSSGLRFALRALRHRNYRLFFTGQGISLIGSWITRVATGWLVYQLTGSELMLGLIAFFGQLPTLLITPIGGVVVDRWSRLRVLLCSQLLLMLVACLLAFFALRGTITVTHLFVLITLQGLGNAFDIPARQALVVELITDRADLSSAIAMNSSIFNAARLIGPAIAGYLLAVAGAGLCYAIDAASFLAVIVAIAALRLPARKPRESKTHVGQELVQGFKAAFGFAPIRAILLLTASTALFGAPYLVLLPAFAKDVLHGGPQMFGLLTSSAGVGALCGALFLATRKDVLGLGNLITVCAALFGTALILFGLSRTVWLSVPLLVLTGFAMMVQTAGCNTVLQTILDDDKRGRVMGFFAMSFLGMMPFGGLLAGAIAQHFGPPVAVQIGGAIVILGALVFRALLPRLRTLVTPIYIERGILPKEPLEEDAAEIEPAVPARVE